YVTVSSLTHNHIQQQHSFPTRRSSDLKCTLEPNKYRAPVSHPYFELFRAWSFINNIKYKESGDKNAYWSPLPLQLKKEILESKRSEEHTSELQSRENLVCRLLLETKKK